MKKLPDHVERSICERKLLRKRERILVAVSGGMDSMALLSLLHTLAPQFGWKLFVAHFNHQLRGRASDVDERFVQRTSDALGLPCKTGRGAVKALAKKSGLSIEMAARELRHKFLARTATRCKCPVIAMAHHADDQVELFFLRLLRGAGGDGLAGMKWDAVSPVGGRLRIVRPLLDIAKGNLEVFAQENGIHFHEDGSNASLDILRNRLRRELLPFLREQFQPALNRTILRLMDIVGADAEVVVETAREWLKLKRTQRPFAKLPVGLQRRIIQLELQQQRIEAGFDLIEALRMLPARPVMVRPGLRLICNAAGRVVRVAAANVSFRRKRAVVRLSTATGRLQFAGADINWRRLARAGTTLPPARSGREFFDAGKIGSRIVLRHWRPGDRFQPIGMKSAVKLQDWFVNQKIPAQLRRELILATTWKGEIFWVEGMRIGEQFRLTSVTRRQLIWGWWRPE